jgi:alkylhydroperoxidase family enzyme
VWLVARIEGVNPDEVQRDIELVFNAQERTWGAPLANHLLYARRPSIFRGARAMWGGLDQSGLLDPALVALINVRVASHNRCEF